MKILYKNDAGLAEITSPEVDPLFAIANIYSGWLYQIVEFTGGEAVITFNFPETASALCEAVGICNTNADRCGISVFDFEGEAVFSKDDLSLEGDFVDVFYTGVSGKIAKAVITLHSDANTNIYCGYIYLGGVFQMPDFLAGPQYSIDMTAEGLRTDGGQAYGVDGEMLRVWKFGFRNITNRQRLEIEKYIRTVQYAKGHIVQIYDDKSVEPIFATLSGADGFTKEARNNFYWQTSLEYKEAR
jgi:hypothetical protein